MSKSKIKESKEFELLVAGIQKKLSSENMTVEHNVKIQGKSGTSRQIDVLVTTKGGQFEFKLVFECKNHKRKIDIKAVEQFIGMLDDINTDGRYNGVMVTSSNFSKAAKNRAKDRGITLYTVIDTGDHNWQLNDELYMPLLIEERIPWVSICISQKGHSGLMFPPTVGSQIWMEKTIIYDDNQQPLGSIADNIMRILEEKQFEIGTYQHQPILDSSIPYMDNGYGEIIPFEIHANIEIKTNKFYKGNMLLKEISGFFDVVRGTTITNKLTLEDSNIKWEEVPIDQIEFMKNTCSQTPIGMIGPLVAVL